MFGHRPIDWRKTVSAGGRTLQHYTSVCGLRSTNPLPKGTSWAAWVNSEGCPSISVTSRQCLSRHWYLETLITVMGLCQSTRILGLEQKGSPGEGNVNSPQYACWENPRDREAWWATVGCDWAGTHIEMEAWPDPTSSRSIVSVAPGGGHSLRAQILSSCMKSSWKY